MIGRIRSIRMRTERRFGKTKGPGCEPGPFLHCAPGMGADLGVGVSHGGCSTEALAEGKGVTAMWGLEEASGKVASR